ncbi:condensation domain-containing protein [Nonomuraea guangzhouensis]|uniref:Condensation domain-containing protein n=1 Tax=Nonomuraea guangzhouensis TaxID=1291555 RepID=A0ABW4GYK9_9ACTN|nr:condensation domain-containing protein [Nonomuraea guangzhouensis]
MSIDFEERARLEARLLSRASARRPARIPALERTGGVQRFPASPSQEGMYAEVLAEPELASIILGGIRLRGHLDVAALERALTALVARHETLRTVFEAGQAGLSQVVLPPGPGRIPVQDVELADFPALTWAEVDTPVDLERGPLFRLRLLRLAEDDHIAMLLIHHIIGDARALEVFVRDLVIGYLAARSGGEAGLPPLPVQYADFATWYRRHLAGPRGDQLLGYWTERLAGAEPARIPTDLTPTEHSISGHTAYFPIPPELLAKVTETARTHRVTLFMLGCAAFMVQLARYSGQRDISVRAPISYRDRLEVEDLIADFSNDIVFRQDLSADPTFTQLLAQVREAATSDFAHHDLPPHLLADELGDPGLLARLFHVQFTTESEPDVDLPTGDLAVELMPPPWQYAFRPLAVRIRTRGRQAVLVMTYRTALFSPERIADLAADYLDLLAELIAGQDLPVFDGRRRGRVS